MIHLKGKIARCKNTNLLSYKILKIQNKLRRDELLLNTRYKGTIMMMILKSYDLNLSNKSVNFGILHISKRLGKKKKLSNLSKL